MNNEQPLLKNIMALGSNDTWASSIKIIEESMAALLKSDFAKRLEGIRRIYLIGCGTSLYAGQVGKSLLEHIAGISAEAVPAHTFSYYYENNMLGKDVMVVGISATGTSETVANTLKQARAAGSPALGITSNMDSSIARASDAVILSGNFDDRTVVKSKSYIYSLMTLYTLAVNLGKLNKACDAATADRWLGQLKQAGEKAEAFYNDQMGLINELAFKFHAAEKMFIIGAGPNLGTMEEAALKMVEMARIYAECQELEDFTHGRFRVADQLNPFFILAPHGKSDERILDFLCVTHHIGAYSIVLTDKVTPELQKLASKLIVMPEGMDEFASPLLYILPFYLLGYKMGVQKGHDPASRRYEDIVPQDTVYSQYKSKLK